MFMPVHSVHSFSSGLLDFETSIAPLMLVKARLVLRRGRLKQVKAQCNVWVFLLSVHVWGVSSGLQCTSLWCRIITYTPSTLMISTIPSTAMAMPWPLKAKPMLATAVLWRREKVSALLGLQAHNQNFCLQFRGFYCNRWVRLTG